MNGGGREIQCPLKFAYFRRQEGVDPLKLGDDVHHRCLNPLDLPTQTWQVGRQAKGVRGSRRSVQQALRVL